MTKYNFFEFNTVKPEPVLFKRSGKATARDGSHSVINFEVWVMPLDVVGSYASQEAGEQSVRAYIGYPSVGVMPTHECPYGVEPDEQMLRDISMVEHSIAEACKVKPENPAYNHLDIARMMVTAPSIYEALVQEVKSATVKLRQAEEEREGKDVAAPGQSPPPLSEKA